MCIKKINDFTVLWPVLLSYKSVFYRTVLVQCFGPGALPLTLQILQFWCSVLAPESCLLHITDVQFGEVFWPRNLLLTLQILNGFSLIRHTSFCTLPVFSLVICPPTILFITFSSPEFLKISENTRFPISLLLLKNLGLFPLSFCGVVTRFIRLLFGESGASSRAIIVTCDNSIFSSDRFKHSSL